MEEDSGRIAEMLRRWANGDKEALGALAPVVYQELRRLAHRHLRAERAGHTLQSTALVNEAFIRLFEGQACTLADRGHFIPDPRDAYAAVGSRWATRPPSLWERVQSAFQH